MEVHDLSRHTRIMLLPPEQFAFTDRPDDEFIGEDNLDPKPSARAPQEAPRVVHRVTGIKVVPEGFTFAGHRLTDRCQDKAPQLEELPTVHTSVRVLPPHLRQEVAYQHAMIAGRVR